VNFRLCAMTESDGSRVCEWKYPPPYDRYCWPAWEHVLREAREFGDPDIRAAQYLSVRSEPGDELAAYVQLFPLDRAIRIGLGLRPDLCGLGYGASIIRLAAEEARRRRPDAEIDLEVEAWNRRAIKAYEKAEFSVQDRYQRRAEHGIVHIVCMVWQPSGDDRQRPLA